MAETKICTICKKHKPLDCFWKNRSTPSGLEARCKDCSVKHWREESYPRLKTTASYQANHRKRQARYIEAHPKVATAHRQARANRSNIKKSACEQCGKFGNLHMHHPDYNRPLDVVTLCVSCHEAAHHRGIPQ